MSIMDINTIKCTHLEYNEIKKYLEVTDETFFDNDLSFYKDIENRLSSCKVCEKRLQAYILMEEPKEIIKPLPPIRVLKALIKKLNSQFEIPKVALSAPATVKSVEGEGIDISIKGEGFGDDNFAITDDGGFWFKLKQPDILSFKLNKDIDGAHEYEVILLRAADEESDEKEFHFILDENKSAELNGGNGLLPLQDGLLPLPEGGYSGIVVYK